MDRQNLTLMTDLYELTMMQGYFRHKDQNETVIFDAFYRKNPCDGGYAICAGLEQVIQYIKELRFDREDMAVRANPEALGRVYRNLIANALRHGGGGLAIFGGEGEIRFSNELLPGSRPDPERLFDRFYQSSPARAKGGAGLGLSIVRELMEQMGGRVSARIDGDILRIMLMFSPGPDSRAIPHEGDAPGGGHIGRYR